MMAKRIISFLLSLVMIFGVISLAGCHGKLQVDVPNEDTSDAEEEQFVDIDATFDPNKKITISFWAKNDNNPTQVEIYKKAIADFQRLYPNITVDFKPYADYGLIYRDVITNISTNTTPNVCISYPDHVATYMQGNDIVVKLDDLMRDSRYGFDGTELKFDSLGQDELIGKFMDEGKIAGGQYAIPFMRSTEACYINKEFVEKLGYTVPDVLTWDFIWEVSEAALAKNPDGTYKINGQTTMIPFIYKSTDNMMISMLRQKGAGYSNENAEIQIFNDTTKELLSAVAAHSGKGAAFSTFKISSYPGNYFNAGQCIFAIDSTAGATWMGTNAPNMDIHGDSVVDVETVVRPIPQFDAENPQMISQGPSICIFNKTDIQEVLASWFFVQFLLTNDVQIAYSQTEGYIPVTQRAHESAEYQDYLSRRGEDNQLYYDIKIDAAKLLLDNIDNTFVTPVFAGSASLRDAAGQMIEEVVKARRRNKTVDNAFMEKLFADMSTLYHLDQVKPIK